MILRAIFSIYCVGIGEVPSGRFPERSEVEAATLACRDAILDAGMSPRDIDVVLPVGALAEQLKIDAWDRTLAVNLTG